MSLLGRPAGIPRYMLIAPLGIAFAVGGIAAMGERPHVPTVNPEFRPAPRPKKLLAVGWVATSLVAFAIFRTPRLESWNISYEGHPEIDRKLITQVSVGDIVVFHQGLSETGYAYGFATWWQDTNFLSDYANLLQSGQPSLILREVVGFDRQAMRISTEKVRFAPVGGKRTVWLIQIYGDNRINALAAAGLIGCLPRQSDDAIHVVDTHVKQLTCMLRDPSSG